MHGPRAGYGGGSGGGSRGKNTEISALEGGPDPPGPPIVGNPGVSVHKEYKSLSLYFRILFKFYQTLCAKVKNVQNSHLVEFIFEWNL